MNILQTDHAHITSERENKEKESMRKSLLIRKYIFCRFANSKCVTFKTEINSLFYRTITDGRCDITIASCFVHRSDDSTRGNQLKLYKCHCTVDVTEHYFANSVINVWNSLPDTVVTAASLLSFRHQLAKFDLSNFCVNF